MDTYRLYIMHASAKTSTSHQAAAMVLKGQFHSSHVARLWHFSITAVLDQWCALIQMAGPPNAAVLHDTNQSPSLRHRDGI